VNHFLGFKKLEMSSSNCGWLLMKSTDV